ncbi:MAG: AEC family transporter [Myxococcota bacterium]
MLVVCALLIAGAAIRRLSLAPAEVPAVLDRLVILLALPGLILHEVPKLEPSVSMVVPVAIAWGGLVTLVLCVALVGRIRGYSRNVLGTLLVVVPLGNTSFLGIPAVTALLGADHVGAAVVYDQLGSFLALVTWGTFAAARWGGGEAPSLRAMARRLATFPPLLALVGAVGLALAPPPIAQPIDRLAEVLGAMLVPMTMLSVGMRLRVPRSARVLEPLVIGLALRLLLVPALAYGALVLFGEPNRIWHTSVLESAMPPMVTASVVAIAAGLDEELAAALVGGGVLLSMATLPLWAWVLVGS